jgi:hypothetical protein
MYNPADFQLPNLDFNNITTNEPDPSISHYSRRWHNRLNNFFNSTRHQPSLLYDTNPISNTRSISNLILRRNDRMLTIEEEESIDEYTISDVLII